MTITGDAPGNIFAAGNPLRFTVNESRGEVSYEVVNYLGATAASGAAAANPAGASIALSGLPPGWYELRCRDSAGTAAVSLGVVIDRGDKPLPRQGRVCADAASAWLVPDAQRARFAHMLRLAAISWVRERLSWGETEPKPGTLQWGKYQAAAEVLAAEGVHIYQIWHDSPAWTHPGNSHTRCPDDLRAVYRFAKASSQQFARQIEAWEVWNEPDIGFWPDLSDRFAGFQKAAYWGLKDGNPEAIVLQGSLCRGVSDFERNLYDCGALDYSDVFNWHIYNVPTTYPAVLRAHRDILREHDTASRPAWLTEAGIGLAVPGGPQSRILSPVEQRRQCQFITQSAVMSLVAGNDRNFYFVLPDYMEGETQFGALRPDLTPYPSFIALSAAANLLGVSDYLGQYRPTTGDAVCHLFSTAQGNVLVAWAEQEGRLEVPTEKPVVSVANIFGDRHNVRTANGVVRVKVGPEAVYVLDIGSKIMSSLSGPVVPRGRMPTNHPSRLVLAGHCDLRASKRDDCYLLEAQQATAAFPFTVDVYNLSSHQAASGVVDVVVPDGWRVEQPQREVRLRAMGRQSLVFQITPSPPAQPGVRRIVVHGSFQDPNVAPSVSTFRIE
jgi:hypothetical protein